MKQIPLPDIDDEGILALVAGRSPIANCPYVESDSEIVLARYESYVKTEGNPFLVGCPQPIVLPGQLQDALKSRYGSDSDYLLPIENLRNNRTLNICPMCGLPGTGTLDHIFPNADFPELGIFSRNLVPTCFRCNVKRRDKYRGNNTGERIFHPYFDDALNTRLVRANIKPNPTFKTPDINLESCLNHDNPLNVTINFHIESVLKSAGVIDDLIIFWANLQRVPRNKLPSLPRGNFASQDFTNAVINARNMADEWFASVNNVYSIMFEGLRLNQAASAYLAAWIREIDVNPGNAQDI